MMSFSLKTTLFVILFALVQFEYTESKLTAWSYDQDLFERHWRHQIGISSNDIVYIFGGSDGVSFSNEIWKSNTANHVFQWELLSVTTPTSKFVSYGQNSISIGNYVYFMGIDDGTSTYGTGVSYVFDMQNEEWITDTVNIPTLPIPTIWGCLETDNDYIYYIGGSNAQNYIGVDIMQTYDISANEWTVSQLPFGESSHAMCTTNRESQYLYLFGGYINVDSAPHAISSIYVYNMALNAWNPQSISDLSVARTHSRAILAPDDKIYIIGGYDNNALSTNVVDIFDPNMHTISSGSNLFKGVFAAPMAVICDRISIFGGAYFNGTNDYDTSSFLLDIQTSNTLDASTSYDYIDSEVITWWQSVDIVLPQAIRSFAFASTANNALYFMSGNNGESSYSSDVYRWNYSDPDSTFSTLSSSYNFYCASKCGVSVSLQSDLIYIIGAQNIADRIFVYDTISNQYVFNTVQDMPHLVVLSCVTSNHYDTIYLVGGYNESSLSIAYLQIYNVSNDEWQSYPEINPIPDNVRHQGSMCEWHNDNVYVFGGRNYDQIIYYSSIYIYDTLTNVWTLSSQSLTSGKSFGRAIYSSYTGYIYIIGGTENIGAANHGCTDYVETYNPKTDEIISIASIPVDICYFAVATFDDKLIVIGGYAGATNYYDTAFITELNKAATTQPTMQPTDDPSSFPTEPTLTPSAAPITVNSGLNWYSYSNLPVQSAQHCMGYNSKTETVYIFGVSLNKIYKWNKNTAHSHWILLSETTPTATFYCRQSSVTIDDLVYFMGTYNGNHQNGQSYIFNLTKEEFITDNIPTMPVASVYGCVATDNNLIFVGGGAQPSLHQYLQIYSIASNQWWSSQTMPYLNYENMCAYDDIHDILYFFGGATSPYGPSYQSFYYSAVSAKTSGSAWSYTMGPSLTYTHIGGYAVYGRTEGAIYLLGGHFYDSYPYVEIFDTTTKSISVDNNLYSKCWGHSAIIIDNRLMIFGGANDVTNTVIQYSSILIETALPTSNPTAAPTVSSSCSLSSHSLPYEVYGHSMVFYNETNTVYLFGGFNSSTHFDGIYKWSLSESQTPSFQPLCITTPITPFYSVVNNVVTVDNIAYFIGLNDGLSAGAIYAFNMQTEQWLDSTDYEAYTINGIYGCLATNDVYIFLIGGRNYISASNVDYVQKYDIASNSWITEQITITPIASNGWESQFCEVVDDRLFVLAGSISAATATNHIIKYNILTYQWSHVGYLPIDAVSGNSVYQHPFIYIIGGNAGGGIRYNEIIVFSVEREQVIATQYMTEKKDDIFPLIVNEELYIFGGREISADAVASIEICSLYNESSFIQTATDLTWKTSISHVVPKELRSFAFTSTVNDTLYILAGSTTDDAYSASIYSWDPIYPHQFVTIFPSSSTIFYCASKCGAYVSAKPDLIYIFGAQLITENTFVFDLDSETYSFGTIASQTYPVTLSCVTSNHIDAIYVVGGFDTSSQSVGYLQIYNVSNNEWISYSLPNNTALMSPMCEYWYRFLYIFGGMIFETRTYYDTIYRYDIEHNEWRLSSDTLSAGKIGGRAIYSESTDLIYIIGGTQDIDTVSCNNSVEIYDPRTDTITNGTAFPVDICYFGVMTYEDEIAILGGYAAYDDVYDHIYTTKVSAIVPSCDYFEDVLPSTTYGHSMAYHEATNSAFMFGGYASFGNWHDSVYKWTNQQSDFFQKLSVTTPTSIFYSTVNNVVTIDDMAYFIGINDGTAQYLNSNIYAFNLSDESWINSNNFASVPYPSNYGCLSTNGSLIFMIGGRYGSSGQKRNYVQIYSIATNIWHVDNITISPFDIHGWEHQICQVVNDKLFVFGGSYVETEPLDGIYKYIISTKEWSKIGTLPLPKQSGAAIYHAPYVLIIGGQPNYADASNTIFVFNPISEEIVDSHYLQEKRYSISALAISQKLYVFGGINEEWIARSNVEVCDVLLASFSTQILSENGNFIWLGPEKTDFTTANNFCKHQYGTTLASIHTESENLEIADLCTSNAADNSCYIGLSDIDSEGTYLWMDGSNVDYIPTAFDTDNADHGSGVFEDCIHVSSDGIWTDTPCNTYHPYTFICNAPASLAIESACYISTNRLPVPLFNHLLARYDATNTVYLIGGFTTDNNQINVVDTIYKINISDPNMSIEAITPNVEFNVSALNLRSIVNNVVSIDNIAYLIGVFDGAWNSGKVYAFDMETETFLDYNNYASPPYPATYGCLANNGTSIFMVGGRNAANSFIAYLQIYDIVSNIWSAEAISASTTIADGWNAQFCQIVDDVLYVFGGSNNASTANFFDFIYKYDILSSQWFLLNETLPLSLQASMSVYNDPYIYIIGGNPPTNTIFVFDPVTEQIIDTLEMRDTRHSVSGTMINQELYVFGGRDISYKPMSTIQICTLLYPTMSPTVEPTTNPTRIPTILPTADPTNDPSFNPSIEPTSNPTDDPSTEPTLEPTNNPTSDPTDDPSPKPTANPTKEPTFTPTAEPTEDFGKKHKEKDCERLKVALTLILQNRTHKANEDTFYYEVQGNPSKMTTIIKKNIESVSDNDSFADDLNIVLIDVTNPSLNRVKLNYNITNCNKNIVVDVYLNSSNFTDELTNNINEEFGNNTVASITTIIVKILPPPLNLKDLSFTNPVTWALLILFILLLVFFISSYIHKKNSDHLSRLPCFHAVDEAKPKDVLFFVLTVGALFNHCHNIYILYYYHINNIDRSPIIWSSAIILSTIVFFQIAFNVLFAAFYTFKFTETEQQTEYEILCNKYWSGSKGRKGLILMFIILSGNFYVTLQLLNSRVFGVEFFWMGMNDSSLQQYRNLQKLGTFLLFISSVIQTLCSIHFITVGDDPEISGFFIFCLVLNIINAVRKIGVQCSELLEYQHYDIVIAVVVSDKTERKKMERNAGKTIELRRNLALLCDVEMNEIEIAKVQRTGTGIKIYAQYICYDIYETTEGVESNIESQMKSKPTGACSDIVRYAKIQPNRSFLLSGNRRQRLEEILTKSQMKDSQKNGSKLQEIITKCYQLNAFPDKCEIKMKSKTFDNILDIWGDGQKKDDDAGKKVSDKANDDILDIWGDGQKKEDDVEQRDEDEGDDDDLVVGLNTIWDNEQQNDVVQNIFDDDANQEEKDASVEVFDDIELEEIERKEEKNEDDDDDVDGFVIRTDDGFETENDELKRWLKEVVNLEQYYSILVDEGYETLDLIQGLTSHDMEEIGIKRGHRIKFMKCIQSLEGFASDDADVESQAEGNQTYGDEHD